VGERTETASARTSGKAPAAPATARELLRANATSIDLNLRAWSDGGCAISSFVVEYRLGQANFYGQHDDWLLVNNNVKPPRPSDESGRFPVLDLKPETRYTLKMTAHNAAGSTAMEYPFTTLTYSGGDENTFHYFE